MKYFLAAFLVFSPLLGIPAARGASEAVENSIHSGDRLRIDVDREKSFSGTFTVDSSGKIHYPPLGLLFVEGLKPSELGEYLTENLMDGYLVNPRVQIEFAEKPAESVRTATTRNKAMLLGQVQKPGNYPLTPGMTLALLIEQAGDFTPEASTHDVRVVRKNQGPLKVMTVDAGEMLSGRMQDLKLEPGDVIVVRESIS